MKADKKTDSRTAEQDGDRLNWRYQDKEYNENFKKWRKSKRDSIGFYYAANPGRLTYQDGVGFINDYPEAHEAKAFRKALTMLGLVLVYRVTVDIFFSFLLPLLMERIGMNIQYSLFSGQINGSGTLIASLEIAEQLLGRLLPAAVLVKHLEIPFSVMLPMKVTNKPMFGFAVPAALLTAGVCAVMSFFYDGLLSTLGIDVSRSQMIPDSASGMVYAFIANVLIVPIVSELCTHGVILQLIRQFGDGTALFLTSIIIAASAYDITVFMFEAAASFVIGYFIIRTGSVLTGVIMRVTVRAYAFALCLLDSRIDSEYSETFLRAFLFLTLMIGLVSTVRFLYFHSDRFSMTIKTGYMSFGRKVLETAGNIPMVIWFTLTFLVTIFNLRFIN